MSIVSSVLTVTTDAAGAGTGRTEQLNGRLLGIFYTKTDYDNGVTFAVTSGVTEQSLWSEAAVNASKKVYPRVATNTVAGAVSTTIFDTLPLADETVLVTVSAGGNTKVGSFTILVEGR